MPTSDYHFSQLPTSKIPAINSKINLKLNGDPQNLLRQTNLQIFNNNLQKPQVTCRSEANLNLGSSGVPNLQNNNPILTRSFTNIPQNQTHIMNEPINPFEALQKQYSADLAMMSSNQGMYNLNPFAVGTNNAPPLFNSSVTDSSILSTGKIRSSAEISLYSKISSDDTSNESNHSINFQNQQQPKKTPLQLSSSSYIDVTSSLTLNRKISLQDFRIVKHLGAGGFGRVDLVEKIRPAGIGNHLNGVAETNDEGCYYAMKSIKKVYVLKEDKDITHTKAERNILQQADHPFIIKLIYAFQDPSKLFLILEFAQQGELFELMQKENKFSESWARFYLSEIALALGYLHDMNVIYRDLKPENILLSKQGHIKLADFGLCKDKITSSENALTFCGTPEYMAPEIILSKGHNKEVDWWCLGTLMWDMIIGGPPFVFQQKQTKKQTQDNIRDIQLDFNGHLGPGRFSRLGLDCVRKLLEKDPRKRLGRGHSSQGGDLKAIQAQPFFSSINWDDLYNRKITPPHVIKYGTDSEQKRSRFPSNNFGHAGLKIRSPQNEIDKQISEEQLIENFDKKFTTKAITDLGLVPHKSEIPDVKYDGEFSGYSYVDPTIVSNNNDEDNCNNNNHSHNQLQVPADNNLNFITQPKNLSSPRVPLLPSNQNPISYTYHNTPPSTHKNKRTYTDLKLQQFSDDSGTKKIGISSSVLSSDQIPHISYPKFDTSNTNNTKNDGPFADFNYSSKLSTQTSQGYFSMSENTTSTLGKMPQLILKDTTTPVQNHRPAAATINPQIKTTNKINTTCTTSPSLDLNNCEYHDRKIRGLVPSGICNCQIMSSPNLKSTAPSFDTYGRPMTNPVMLNQHHSQINLAPKLNFNHHNNNNNPMNSQTQSYNPNSSIYGSRQTQIMNSTQNLAINNNLQFVNQNQNQYHNHQNPITTHINTNFGTLNVNQQNVHNNNHNNSGPVQFTYRNFDY